MRELIALGHEVRVVPPSGVKACLKRGKNDATECRSYLRGGDAAEHALRADEEKGGAHSFFAVDFHHLLLAGFPAPAVRLNLSVA